MNIEEFFSFTGLNYGDTTDNIFDSFGAPDDTYSNPDNSYTVFYFKYQDEFTLNISFSNESQKIESIFLGLHSKKAVTLILEKYGIYEPKACFIGNTLDEIIDYFGLPSEQNRNFVTYNYKKIEVEFYCPDERKAICTRIKVKWFYK